MKIYTIFFFFFFLLFNLCNSTTNVNDIMKRWLTTKPKSSEKYGLHMMVNMIWPKICIKKENLVDSINIDSCPSNTAKNRQSDLVLGSEEVRTALDSSYVNITVDKVIIPVCHPIVHLSFISVKHSDILKDRIKFIYCNHTKFADTFADITFPSFPPCCDSKNLPTNINNLPIYSYNCNEMRGYSCHPQFNSSLIDKSIQHCIKITSSPTSTFTAYSVCNGDQVLINSNETLIIHKELLDSYPNAVKNKTSFYSSSNTHQQNVVALRYKNDIIIGQIPYDKVLDTECSTAEKNLETLSLSCEDQKLECKKCKDNLCTEDKKCTYGCKNELYQSPQCTELKLIGAHLNSFDLSATMCYCLNRTNNDPNYLRGRTYCDGKTKTEFFSWNDNDILCFRDIEQHPLSSLTRSYVLNATKPQVLLVTQQQTALYVDTPAFPHPCKNVVDKPGIQVISQAKDCVCNTSLCIKDICTDYQGCIIGCKDQTSIEPWCNTTKKIHQVSLIPAHATRHIYIPDNINDDNRMAILYVLCGIMIFNIIVIVGLLLSIEFHLRKQKKS